MNYTRGHASIHVALWLCSTYIRLPNFIEFRTTIQLDDASIDSHFLVARCGLGRQTPPNCVYGSAPGPRFERCRSIFASGPVMAYGYRIVVSGHTPYRPELSVKLGSGGAVSTGAFLFDGEVQKH